MVGISSSFSFLFSLLAILRSAYAAPNGVSPSPRLTRDVGMFKHGGINPAPVKEENASVNVISTHPDTISTTSSVASASSSPRFVIYSDKWVSGETGPPNVTAVAVKGAYDKAAEWTQLTAAQRSTVKAQYNAAGVKLLVSLFGSTDAPTSTGADPVDTANTMAAWAIQYGLDGVDVDYEDFNAIDAGNGKAEAWLTTFTQQLRVNLPQGQYIITHAPVAPWFSPGIFGGGAYLTVNKNVGSIIDWSALFQIAASGVSLNKLVIGKPANTGDANNGYIAPATLSTCITQAKAKGWNAGVMVWEFPDATASWIKSVRAQAFPE
ncbi:hypothetical protein Clacol_005041 [Clathrus columnatus]|uniref:GH18 domain-containing protein n=1 Tax=Clathrus columnatus TaxID=1419009 RepID=A0AAV5ADT3_9AGAM|nr:hypothetical protein Clacol_005041 [Clathrus columnatus]